MGVRGIALLVMIGTVALAAPDDEPSPRKVRNAFSLTSRGHRSLSKGNTRGALEDFRAALALVPFLPGAHVGMGHLATRERRFEDALREYRLAGDGLARMAAVLAAMENDRYVRAQDEIQRLTGDRSLIEGMQRQEEIRAALSGSNPTGSSARRLEREKLDLDSRIRNLQRIEAPADREAPGLPADLLFYQGNSLFNLGRLDEAVAAWEECARRDEKFSLVHNNLAVAYWKQGRIDEAKASISRAEALGLRVNPDLRADLERASRTVAGAVPQR